MSLIVILGFISLGSWPEAIMVRSPIARSRAVFGVHGFPYLPMVISTCFPFILDFRIKVAEPFSVRLLTPKPLRLTSHIVCLALRDSTIY